MRAFIAFVYVGTLILLAIITAPVGIPVMSIIERIERRKVR